MKFLKPKKVDEYLDAVRHYVDGMDTAKEVRSTVAYTFLIGVTDALTELGVPGTTAAKAAARMTIQLPEGFHNDYPEEFAELVRLYTKTIFVLWKTVLADFDDGIYEDIFLSLAKQTHISLEL